MLFFIVEVFWLVFPSDMDYAPIVDVTPQGTSTRYFCGPVCDPKSRWHRYSMLLFICLLTFGSYFCYDNPAALQDAFLTELHLTVTQFMNLYAFYSWPNVFLSFIGGFLIDRYIGIRWGAILFSSIVFIGQCVFALGAYVSNVPLMYISRLIFGIGGESLSVVQNAYASAWYTPREVSVVFALSLSFARIGSTVNMNVMRPIFKAIGKTYQVTGGAQMGLTLLVASVTCLSSVGCAIALAYFYRR